MLHTSTDYKVDKPTLPTEIYSIHVSKIIGDKKSYRVSSTTISSFQSNKNNSFPTQFFPYQNVKFVLPTYYLLKIHLFILEIHWQRESLFSNYLRYMTNTTTTVMRVVRKLRMTLSVGRNPTCLRSNHRLIRYYDQTLKNFRSKSREGEDHKLLTSKD